MPLVIAIPAELAHQDQRDAVAGESCRTCTASGRPLRSVRHVRAAHRV